MSNSMRNSFFTFTAPPPTVIGVIPKSDRKSTRLNSSHSQISYAVFCLKQKHLAHERIGFPVEDGLKADQPLIACDVAPLDHLHDEHFAVQRRRLHHPGEDAHRMPHHA